MFSHANLNSGQTTNYYKKDDYYKSQDKGIWVGELSKDKQLTGGIKQDDFNALIMERGTRQGHEIHLGYVKNFDGEGKEAKEALIKAGERVKEYIEKSGIEIAGRVQTRATSNGLVLTVSNKSTISEEGIRKFVKNDEFLLHKEKMSNVFREAIIEQTVRDVGKIE